MKRDWEKIRKLLEVADEQTSLVGDIYEPKDGEWFNRNNMVEYLYHFNLIKDSGLIGTNSAIHAGGRMCIDNLTMKGHDFLEAMKNDTTWKKIKEHFKTKGVDMTIDLIMAVAEKIVMKQLGL
ncbi:MAG: DUF2513 domain-containing protein [Candidatus Pacebacteria bacterium]|nr:DUF2513 domain-containing protein [Candidatus Paceibacterota bacterium]